jgi:periplasmic protein TonB
MRVAGRLLSILGACLISALVLAAFEREPVHSPNAPAISFDAAQFSVNISFSAAAPKATQSRAATEKRKEMSANKVETTAVEVAKSHQPDRKTAKEVIKPTAQHAALEATKSDKAQPDQLLSNYKDSPQKTSGSAALPVNGTEPVLALPQNTNPSFADTPTAPNYPKLAQKRGQQGTVWLEIWLDQLGRQTELKVQNSSGVSSLDKAALKAVSSWKFLPLIQGGQAIASRVQVPVEFVLN